MVLLRLCWWIKNWKEPFPYSPNEVMRNPNCLLWQPPSPHLERKGNHQIQVNQDKLVWEVEVLKSAFSVSLKIGGSLHDTKGMLLCAFSCAIPQMVDTSAEILAVHRAIQISLNNTRFKEKLTEIKTKSQRVVEWCVEESGGPTSMQFILNFIRKVSSKGISCSIKRKKTFSRTTSEIIAKMGLGANSNSVVWIS